MASMRARLLHPIPHLAAVGNIEARRQSACRCYPTNPARTPGWSSASLPQFPPQSALQNGAQRRPGFECLPLGFEQKVLGELNIGFRTLCHTPRLPQ